MNGDKVFFDTNVLLYLLSHDTSKADRAESLLSASGWISVQVLNEFASVARRKLIMTWDEIQEVLTAIRAFCRVAPLTLDTHDMGLDISRRYGFAIYDALILASALLAGCTTLYTEDLQDGQGIEDRLIIRNPFQ